MPALPSLAAVPAEEQHFPREVCVPTVSLGLSLALDTGQASVTKARAGQRLVRCHSDPEQAVLAQGELTLW